MTGAPVQIRPIDLMDAARVHDAQAWSDVYAAVQRDRFGATGSAQSLAEHQARSFSPYVERVRRAAWSGDRLVGALEVRLPLADNLHLAMFALAVDPGTRGRGVGSALVVEAEAIASGHGRATVITETEWAHGSADAAEDFAKRHGYVVGSTMLRNTQALPADRDTLEAAITAGSAQDYAFDSYLDHMPDSWLGDRAVLQQRMSTDAPSDDLELEEEQWDAARLRSSLDRSLKSGRRIVETVARHVPSGQLVGFTQVMVSASQPGLAYQDDTLVLREHRGHALGLRLKATNALRLMDALPEVTSVRTWNADSNAHMLAVNRRLGYVVDGHTREWQKHLAPESQEGRAG